MVWIIFLSGINQWQGSLYSTGRQNAARGQTAGSAREHSNNKNFVSLFLLPQEEHRNCNHKNTSK
jgi:hypothetical protein